MLKYIHSQPTDTIDKLQANLVLILFSYVDDYESLLSDRIDILMNISERLFDYDQDNIIIDKKILDRTFHSPVNIADGINDTSRLLRNKFTGINIYTNIAITNVNRHSFIDSFRILS